MPGRPKRMANEIHILSRRMVQSCLYFKLRLIYLYCLKGTTTWRMTGGRETSKVAVVQVGGDQVAEGTERKE